MRRLTAGILILRAKLDEISVRERPRLASLQAHAVDKGPVAGSQVLHHYPASLHLDDCMVSRQIGRVEKAISCRGPHPLHRPSNAGWQCEAPERVLLARAQELQRNPGGSQGALMMVAVVGACAEDRGDLSLKGTRGLAHRGGQHSHCDEQPTHQSAASPRTCTCMSACSSAQAQALALALTAEAKARRN